MRDWPYSSFHRYVREGWLPDDWAGDIGEISRDLAEAALAHSLGATEGAYRRLTAVERRRAVMEAYARWLNDDNAKVVAFPTSKTA